jgi:hypothetical protein
MEGSKIIVLVLFIISVPVHAASTSVINTGDWKEVSVAKNIADLRGEQDFTVVTPNDAQVASHTIENPETLYTGDSPTFRNLEERTDREFEDKMKVSWKNFSRRSEGFVVVNPEFGTDAAAVLPYASRKNYSIVFYRKEIEQELSETRKPIVYYGNFELEEDFPDSEFIEGSWQDRNLELARRMESNWALLTSRNYFDPEEIDNKPVIFRMNYQRLSDFIDNSSIERIKVIGPENMLYAKEIDALTSKDISIVAKTGRAFTGISDLEGIYGLKKVEIPHRRYNLELYEVSKNSNGSVNLEFLNQGNTDRRVNISVSGEQFDIVVPAFSSLHRTVNVSNKTFDIKYDTDKGSEESQYDLEKLEAEDFDRLTDLKIVETNYTGSELELRVRNSGDQGVWSMVQVSGEYDRQFIGPSQEETLRVEKVGDVEFYRLYQGRFENQYTYSRKYSVDFSRPAGTGVLVASALLIIAVIGSTAYVLREFTR